MQCVNNMKQLGIAFHNYHDSLGSFPIGRQGINHPTGWAGYRWDATGNNSRRTWSLLILPYIEQSSIMNAVNFNLGYNNAQNSTAINAAIGLFSCPTDPNAGTVNAGGAKFHLGNYMVNWGNATYAQDGIPAGSPYSGPAPGGPVTFLGAPFAVDKCFGLQAITDGSSNTLLMSEVIACAPNGSLQDLRGLVYNDDSNGSMFMAYTPPNSPIHDVIKNPYCVYPYQTNPPCKTVTASSGTFLAFNAARSFHSGGVNAMLADGSVRFSKNSIAIATWRALSTTRGGEVVSSDSY
jgi:prepilin-type processing-associated H-X9-DG protein